jgi:hypothetical protein
MRKVAADPCALVIGFPSAPGGTRLLLVERYTIVDIVADRLNERPAALRVVE